MIRFVSLVIAILFTSSAYAEFVGTELLSDDNETVIEQELFTETSQEEPIFSNRESERTIANLEVEKKRPEMEFQGQLRVVNEIPYSYAWVSHQTIRRRVLAEIEAEEAKK